MDRWGRMRPSALLEIMQETAGDHAALLGVGRDVLAPRGLFWAIVRQTIEINRLPGIGETVLAETWPGPPSRTAYPAIWWAGRPRERNSSGRWPCGC